MKKELKNLYLKLLEIKGFKVRKPQYYLSNYIYKKLDDKENIEIIEASTGIGKTLSYLIPIMISGKKAIISTSTISLQNQIKNNEIKILNNIFQKKIKILILKGMNNYICKLKVDNILFDNKYRNFDEAIKVELNYIKNNSMSGEINEIKKLKIDNEVKNKITASSDDCQKNNCNYFNECFVYNQRKKISKNHIIVVNHALLVTDLINDLGFFKGHDLLLIDEAHNFIDIVLQSKKISLSIQKILKFIIEFHQKVMKVTPSEIFLLKEIDNLNALLNESLKDNNSNNFKFYKTFNQNSSSIINYVEVNYLKEYSSEITYLNNLNVNIDEVLNNDHYQKLDKNTEDYYPTKIENTLNLNELDKKVIMLSGTIAYQEYFLKNIFAINSYKLKKIKYNEDLTKQIYFITNRESTPKHDLIISKIIYLIKSVKGRSLLLFTSYESLNFYLHHLRAYFKNNNINIEIFSQTEDDKIKINEKFMEKKEAVLFGTSSFFEGIDYKNNQIKFLFLDKIPFYNPSYPITKSLVGFLTKNNKNPFNHLYLPSAITKLRQIIGRLIRSKSQKGIFYLNDSRIISKSYGKLIMKSLAIEKFQFEYKDSIKFIK